MQKSVTIKPTEIGRALHTVEPISSGETVWRYEPLDLVERLTLAQIHALPPVERACFESYCWQSNLPGEPASWEGVRSDPEEDPLNFINHSCRPNMAFRSDTELVAIRDIPAGDPLTIEYATCDTVYAPVDECGCRESVCRGRVTQEDALDKKIIGWYLDRGMMRSCILALHSATTAHQ